MNALRPPVERGTRVRFGVLFLLACAATSAYMTRGLGAANTTIVREFDISDATMGEVLAAFNLGYVLFQVPGGLLASRFGVRVGLSLMALAWSACTVAASLSDSAANLGTTRILLGLAQAGMVPCIAKVVADWFPLSGRGLMSAVVTSSMQIGAIAASGLTALLLEPVGWRGTLQLYAALGVAWSVLFWYWFRNTPQEHSGVNATERGLIAQGRETQRPTDQPAETTGNAADVNNQVRDKLLSDNPLAEKPAVDRLGPPLSLPAVALRMLTSVTMWAFCLQAFFRAYAYELFGTWFAPFLEKGYGVSAVRAGQLATIPTTAILVGSLLAGVAVDKIYRTTGSTYWSRSGAAIAGMALAGLSFLVALGFREPVVVVAIVSVGAFFSALGSPATWAAAMDLGGRYTPLVVGVMNMVGSLGAYYSPRQVGLLFDAVGRGQGNWDQILWLFAAVNLATAICWLLVNPSRSLDRQPRG